MRTFVMGDVHGNIKALKQCLERSSFDYENDTLIQLGDVADGFAYVYECVEELLKIRNRIDIRGNHDEWFRRYLETGIHIDSWHQGGNATANSYLRQIGKEGMTVDLRPGYLVALNPDDVPATHRKFFEDQILYYKDENNNIFVHAGFNRDWTIEMCADNYPYDLYWNRHFWREALSCKGADILTFQEPVNKVFIGHTQINDFNNPYALPLLRGGAKVWNLDTGAGFSGKLTIMNVDTEQFWQSDWAADLYQNEKGR